MLTLIIVILLVLLLFGYIGVPSARTGYYGGGIGIVGFILIVLLILILLGYVHV